jgi:ABC-type oligopeptide transport system ATPase subunit
VLGGGRGVLTLEGVSKTYRTGAFGGKRLRAVNAVSFDIEPGQVVSLIGESGSGKSTIGRMILRLVPASEGAIRYDGVDVSGLERGRLKDYYRGVQGVFQDPFSSCNPMFRVDRVFSMIRTEYFPRVSRADWGERVESALSSVRLDPSHILGKYPHQLSGGQLQRLLIARALTLDVRLLVADEIISMLDASTRIDVLNLLGSLKERGLGVLFITHDLSLGNYISDRTVILHRGAVVEIGETPKVFANPQHPYTRMLIGSVPQLHEKWQEDSASEAWKRASALDSVDAAALELVEVEPGHLVARAAS